MLTLIGQVGSQLGCVVVKFDIELADRATVRLLEPSVDAVRVEEVETRHRSHLICYHVVAQANQALSQGLVLFLRNVLLDLWLS